MTARRVGYLSGIAVAVSSGAYVFVYLYRWEWNRALFAGAVFLAAEIALLGAVVLERLARIDRRLDAADGRVVQRIRETAPEPGRPFAWLDPKEEGLGVFVPILMGAGILASALAWVVERLARATAGRAMEHDLAEQLHPLAWPTGGLVPPPDEAVALITGAGVAAGGGVRRWRAAAGPPIRRWRR